jgi:hypothetical protein
MCTRLQRERRVHFKAFALHWKIAKNEGIGAWWTMKLATYTRYCSESSVPQRNRKKLGRWSCPNFFIDSLVAAFIDSVVQWLRHSLTHWFIDPLSVASFMSLFSSSHTYKSISKPFPIVMPIFRNFRPGVVPGTTGIYVKKIVVPFAFCCFYSGLRFRFWRFTVKSISDQIG